MTSLSLEQLVEKYVAARRRDYVAQAWAAFAEADYREAQRRLMLADSASAESPASRPSIKLALVYVGIAAKQYSQAA